jgi:predicted RNA-binding protein YlxR (DUF448 family)
MKTRKIPLRTCCVTREQLPKQELFRVVRNKSLEVFIDPTHKANGRGAYLKKDKAVIEKARKANILSKHLNVEVGPDVYEQLLGELNE